MCTPSGGALSRAAAAYRPTCQSLDSDSSLQSGGRVCRSSHQSAGLSEAAKLPGSPQGSSLGPHRQEAGSDLPGVLHPTLSLRQLRARMSVCAPACYDSVCIFLLLMDGDPVRP